MSLTEVRGQVSSTGLSPVGLRKTTLTMPPLSRHEKRDALNNTPTLGDPDNHGRKTDTSLDYIYFGSSPYVLTRYPSLSMSGWRW